MINNQSRILISVIVCTYNRSTLLTKCLESLARQTLSRDCFEVIVINNNSDTETQEIILKFRNNYSNFKTFCENRQGLSNARNKGWKEAKGKYIAFIDDDATAKANWCEKILTAFKTIKPEPVAVGGIYQPVYETKPPKWFLDDFEIRTWGKNAHFLIPPRARYGFSGSNMAFKRRILEEFHGFSDEYGVVGNTFRAGEETEFFNKVYKKSPFFWYDPTIVIYHWASIDKFRVSYRFVRAFRSGIAITKIKENTDTLFEFIKSLLLFTNFCLGSLFRLILCKGSKITFIVKFIENAGEKLGSMYALVIKE